MSGILSKVLGATAWAATGLGIGLFLFYAPPLINPANREPLGEAFRIFFFHVPAAWVAGIALFGSFIASIGYLVRRTPGWDYWAVGFAETGWVLATIVLISGPLWAKAAWGTYWTWEPRLTSFLVLWILYLAYLMLRNGIDDPEKRARYSAVLGIIAFLDIPLIFFSIKLWGSIGHPPPNYGFFRDPVIRNTILANTAAFLLLALHFSVRRANLERTANARRVLVPGDDKTGRESHA